MLARVVDKPSVRFALQLGQRRGHRLLHGTHQPKRKRCTMAELRAFPVDLDDLRVGRIKRPVWEIAAEQQQRVARHHRVIARAEADQPGHADIVWIVVFDELFAAQRVDNRCAEGIGKRHYFIVRALHAAAAHDCDGVGRIQQVREAIEVSFGGQDSRRRGFVPGRCFGRTFAQRHVARQHDHRDAALLHRSAHRACQYAWQLRR